MEDNSSICELTGYDIDKLTKDKLYDISKKLFAKKKGLEDYLSKKTNDLFDLQDEIILYDLTNIYFEGDKRSSNLAQYGRSKEKRSDCPLVVLALVVNVEGFIKHSSIFQGNMSQKRNNSRVDFEEVGKKDCANPEERGVRIFACRWLPCGAAINNLQAKPDLLF